MKLRRVHSIVLLLAVSLGTTAIVYAQTPQRDGQSPQSASPPKAPQAAATGGDQSQDQSEQPRQEQGQDQRKDKRQDQQGNQPLPSKPASGENSNPFPGESTDAPVLPTTRLASDGADESPAEANRYQPTADTDPVHSPDDSQAADLSGGVDTLFSSSRTGIVDHSLLDDDSDKDRTAHHGRGRDGKIAPRDIPHQETAASDVQVGSYYLDRKNWKAALSRFQSARILDPENPDAFFGMAEAERHLGDNANARIHYETVLEYDPDGAHAKAARKALKELPLAAPSGAGTAAIVPSGAK